MTTVSDTGSIKTAGSIARGIYNYGSNNTTTVSGSITTTGEYSYGIWNEGSNNTTTVSGSITTGNDTYADGIYNYGNSNTTTVSGSITTAGSSAYGIRNTGSTNTTTVSEDGSITTTGDDGCITAFLTMATNQQDHRLWQHYDWSCWYECRGRFYRHLELWQRQHNYFDINWCDNCEWA